MKYYKIRDLRTMLFSLGGEEPEWDEAGRVWKNIGPMKNHLNAVVKKLGVGATAFWEVVEIDMVEGDRYAVAALLKKKE